MERAGILRTLAFSGAWGYAPTRLQLAMFYDRGSDGAPDFQTSELDPLIDEGTVVESEAHLALKSFADQIQTGREREFYFPRKLRRARKVAAYLRRLPWVRAVCLCNTTALGQARDESDLDFFIIAKAGAIWRTRFFSTLPFKLLGARPRVELGAQEGTRQTDPVCLSFFVTDDNLDLSNFMLPGDDPYFRYWFLSLLPLSDDGILDEFWENNKIIRKRHPYAEKWMALDGEELISKYKTLSKQSSWLENKLKEMQNKQFPNQIKQMANQDTRVIINEHVLKFHVDDRREEFRQKYFDICKEYGVEP